jgi:hypothetical protein
MGLVDARVTWHEYSIPVDTVFSARRNLLNLQSSYTGKAFNDLKILFGT